MFDSDEARSVDLLTSSQEGRLSALRDKWIAIGLSTDRSDRPRAEAGVRLAYRRAGLSDAVRMIWASSPISGAIIADSLTWRANAPRAVARLTPRATPGVSPPVMDDASMHIRDAVVQPMVTRVAEQVWRPISQQVARHLKRPIPAPQYGQHDASWLAVHDALGQSGGVSPLEAFTEIAQSCGWWWPFEDVCVLSERHSCLACDERGRLHCSNGPAVAYPDGWSIYAWHGVTVDAGIILHPELITGAEIQRETNLEVRRVLEERSGVAWCRDLSDAWS